MQVNVLYHHALSVDVLGDSNYVLTRKYGVSGNNTLIVNTRDMSFAIVADTQVQILVTYIDY